MRRLYRLAIILVVAIIAAGGYIFITTPRYSNTEYHTGDLIVTDSLEIRDTRYVIDGSIIVKGNGKLTIIDSKLEFPQESNNQYHIEVGDWGSPDSPEVYFDNVIIDANWKWMYASYAGSSKVTIIDCNNGNTPWNSAGSNVEIKLVNSDVGFTVADNVKLQAENCRLFLEFVIRDCSGTYTMPKGKVDELIFQYEMGDDILLVETT